MENELAVVVAVVHGILDKNWPLQLFLIILYSRTHIKLQKAKKNETKKNVWFIASFLPNTNKPTIC